MSSNRVCASAITAACVAAMVMSLGALHLSAAPSSALDSDAEFRSCPAPEGCPLMVRIPGANNVNLGSPPDEPGKIGNEQQHSVTIGPFSIGKYEVTVGEYLACVAASGCPEPEWRVPGGQHNVETGANRYYKNLGVHITDSDRPVVGVSHSDAVAYAAWLSAKTGQSYRLASEREWEYAARGGRSSAYWWGDTVRGPDGQPMANCETCGSADDAKGASPVGSFAANPFGLHDMNGNAWEWVSDFYCADYADVSSGNVRTKDNCSERDAKGLRTLRGGSSFYGADKARAASRLRNFAGFRNFSVGFRVVLGSEIGKESR